MWENKVGAGEGETLEPLRALSLGREISESTEPTENSSGPMLGLASALVITARLIWEGPAREADLVPRILQIGRIELQLRTSSPDPVGHFATPP